MELQYIWRNRGVRFCALVIGMILLISVLITILVYAFSENVTPQERAERLLAEVLLFDGHNDFPTNARLLVNNDLRLFNFSQNLTTAKHFAGSNSNYSQTDLFRLRIGRVKAQFWVARAECDSQFKDAVEIVLEQIDLIKRLASNYSEEMSLVTSYQELMTAVEENKIASLITVCCGHTIQSSFGILRLFYDLGVRALTLVPALCSTPWGDSSVVERPNLTARMRPILNNGLSPFGEEIVVEMNRLGMVIDISESSSATMKDVLNLSLAPIIFSHAAANSLCNNEKNIPDDVLKLVRQKHGLIMVTFYPNVLRCDGKNSTIMDVVDHLQYLREKTTIDNIGIGSDFDAVDSVTEGLEDVSKFPNLFAALIETGRWSDEDLEKLAGQNMLRVLQEVETVRDKMSDVSPRQSMIKLRDLKKLGYDKSCSTHTLHEPEPQPQFELSKSGKLIPKTNFNNFNM